VLLNQGEEKELVKMLRKDLQAIKKNNQQMPRQNSAKGSKDE
jgi:hypothetical protein